MLFSLLEYHLPQIFISGEFLHSLKCRQNIPSQEVSLQVEPLLCQSCLSLPLAQPWPQSPESPTQDWAVTVARV